MERLYIVTRADLAPGARAAQACHAVAEFSARFPEPFVEWARAVRNLIVLEAPTEAAVESILDQLLGTVPAVGFREPDFGDELTAIAFDERGRKLVSNLPLALRSAA